jgi:cytochrome c-type biogenesis protein
MGASATFIRPILNFSFTLFGQVINLQKIAGLVIVVFGCHLIGFYNFSLLNRNLSLQISSKYRNNLISFILGIAFAFGWTPCIGPVLGSILALSASEASVGKGILLLSFYSLGLAIPFIASGYFMNKFLNSKKGFGKYYGRITKTGGAVLLVTGILIATNQIQVISYYILTILPFLTTLG